jgi:hypothetical protein
VVEEQVFEVSGGDDGEYDFGDVFEFFLHPNSAVIVRLLLKWRCYCSG